MIPFGLALAAFPATAAEGARLERHGADVFLLPVLLAAGLLYARGAWVLWTRKDALRVLRGWHVTAFATGFLVAAVALLPPLATLATERFSMHMARQELLMLVAAPLFALGRPRTPLLWTLPSDARRELVASLRTFRIHPLVPVVAHGLAIWLWHLPALVELTLRSDGARALQLFMLIGTAFWFFSALVSRRMSPGLSVVSVFATVLHTSVLGAIFTFSTAPWYRFPAEPGFDRLVDQRFAGILMWLPAGLLFGVVGLAQLSSWLERADRPATPSNVAPLKRPRRPNRRSPA